MHYKNMNLKFKEYTKDPGICGRNRPFCKEKDGENYSDRETHDKNKYRWFWRLLCLLIERKIPLKR